MPRYRRENKPLIAPYPRPVSRVPRGKFLYAIYNGAVYAFTISNGVLTLVNGGAYSAGTSPDAMTFTPDGKFLVVANFGTPPNPANISVFSIGSTGALTPAPGSPFASGAELTAVAVDPSGSYVYAASSGGTGGLYGYGISATGGLTAMPGSPFGSGAMVQGLAIY
jgi:DNA-binding beta-propeller fold protein YncE